eukprot:6749441-Pyramimonas_sp.AAC.1
MSSLSMGSESSVPRDRRRICMQAESQRRGDIIREWFPVAAQRDEEASSGVASSPPQAVPGEAEASIGDAGDGGYLGFESEDN